MTEGHTGTAPLVVVTGANGGGTVLNYFIQPQVSTLEESYDSWVASRKPPLFGINPDARVTARHFYELFDSREALLAALYDRIIDELNSEALSALQAAAPNPQALVTRVVGSVMRHYIGDARRARIGLSPSALRAVVRAVWLRDPTAAEAADFRALADAHGLAAVARLLLNSNEFVYVD